MSRGVSSRRRDISLPSDDSTEEVSSRRRGNEAAAAADVATRLPLPPSEGRSRDMLDVAKRPPISHDEAIATKAARGAPAAPKNSSSVNCIARTMPAAILAAMGTGEMAMQVRHVL